MLLSMFSWLSLPGAINCLKWLVCEMCRVRRQTLLTYVTYLTTAATTIMTSVDLVSGMTTTLTHRLTVEFMSISHDPVSGAVVALCCHNDSRTITRISRSISFNWISLFRQQQCRLQTTKARKHQTQTEVRPQMKKKRFVGKQHIYKMSETYRLHKYKFGTSVK